VSQRTRVCIVSTVNESENVVDSFIRYHLTIGFAHIFLYFDNPHDSAISIAQRYPQVSAIPSNERLRQQQQQLRIFPSVSAFVHEIMARQILNVETAIEFALEMSMHWILHIDGDELFYTSGSITEHFENTPHSVGQVGYRNFEAVPETWEVRDYFREATLFKKHEHLLPPRAAQEYKQLLNRENYFLGYGNGKSAARVVPGLLPSGVHEFTTTPAHAETLSCSGGPVVLHYNHCGFENYERKYRRLGADNWLGVPIPFDFYRKSRSQAGNRDGLSSLYRREVLIDDPGVVQQLIDRGILTRIEGPTNLLRQNRRCSEWEIQVTTEDFPLTDL